MRRRAFVIGIVATVLLFAAPPATAEEISGERFAQLVRDAEQDEDARAALREVTSVNGRPVNGELILQDATEDEIDERLQTLAEALPEQPASRTVVDPQATARSILDGERFKSREPPRPLRGLLENLGNKLRQLFDDIAVHLPGGEWTLWGAIALLVILLVVFLIRRLSAKVAARQPRIASAGRVAPRDPKTADDAAATAEAAGNYREAVRLRFTAGLLRLDKAGALTYRPSLTSTEASLAVRSRAFDELASSFNRIVYGRRDATAADAEAARAGWKRLFAERAA